MNAQVLINPNACVEIGRTDFHAANLAAASARRAGIAADQERESAELFDAIEAFVRASGLPREEAELRAFEAQHLAHTLTAAVAQAEKGFAVLQRAGLAEADDAFLDVLADAFADRFARSPELARVFRASLAMGAL